MNRRNFLRNTVPVALLPGLINGFGFKAFGNSPLLNALMGSETDNDHVLVLIQLNGGNDGLNMVIPIQVYGNYYKARTNIAIPQNKILSLSGNTKAGLHPAMTGLQNLYTEEKLCVVQSVGYPSPNFSHFRATDIWTTGSDADEIYTTGWAGRYLNYKFPGYPAGYPTPQMPDPLAIQIGSVMSTAFQGPDINMGMAITNPTDFYNLLNGVQDPAPPTPAGKELTYVRQIARQTDQYGKTIMQAAGKVTKQYSDYPDNALAAQLKIVARLIGGGLKTKMYMVELGGFDTHSAQVSGGDTTAGTHAALLKTISEAVSAFMADLQLLSVSKRVVGMTFSEFGRRIKSNGSTGTDHGAAAPLFVFGELVQNGVLGVSPQIPDAVSVGDNLPMQYDFRSVYGSLLEQWFCVPPETVSSVLLKDYQSLPLVKAEACKAVETIPDVNDASGTYYLNIAPNPFVDSAAITFESHGGHTLLQVFDTLGRLVKVLVNGDYAAGRYTVTLDAGSLASGMYYIRLQNKSAQRVEPVMKVR